MNARPNDLARIQEIYDISLQTKKQIKALQFNKERFLNPSTDQDDLIAEGLMNRVFRITEEAGRITENVALRYGFDTRGARGIRNRLAHVYMEVDRDIIWATIEEDLDILIDACLKYCEDNEVEIG